MSLIFSLSGTRAIIGDSFDPTLSLNMAMAFGQILGKGPVIVGGDTRVSYEMVKGTVISGLLSVGVDVIDIGKVTTPTVQQEIRHHNAAGGIVITASHNPIQWNGIKLMNKTGSFLDTEEYDAFKSLYDTGNFKLATWDKLGTLTEDPNAIDRHIDKILSLIDVSVIKTSGLKVLIDANNGAGAIANPNLMDKLGVSYDILNPEPNGRFNHDPEPLQKNLSGVIEKMKEGDYDIGFIQDADADRLVILDENGRFIGEDYSLAYCIDYILEQEATESTDIVVNLSTSLIIKHLADKYKASLHYTKIGESNVTQKLKEKKALVGGEGNGGIIYPKIGWGRDSLVGIVIALKHLAESKTPVSETVSNYPKFVMSRDKFQVSTREEVSAFLNKVEQNYSDKDVNKEDGIKVMLDNSWIHVRPSNTEPIVRIFVEAQTESEVKRLTQEVKNL
ncbi:phosphoglucosamine mutase [Candidatus Marinamargulisbacteria bacterium SCGC AAA071-K20]|nr:phosphoglucosamine mutase [Candidatus Marinamargulisbacteria bacterium SCGC AAA071-K20]